MEPKFKCKKQEIILLSLGLVYISIQFLGLIVTLLGHDTSVLLQISNIIAPITIGFAMGETLIRWQK
jgi:hypothetical protein